MNKDKPQTMHCPCGSARMFLKCCGPYMDPQSPTYLQAPSPEALMRSRFSAYVLKDYAYIFETYAEQAQRDLSIASLESSDAGTVFTKLHVVFADKACVEFKAYYLSRKRYYCMHERSYFVREQNQWKYANGDMLADTGQLTLSRNNECACGSGKKFKRCCMLLES